MTETEEMEEVDEMGEEETTTKEEVAQDRIRNQDLHAEVIVRTEETDQGQDAVRTAEAHKPAFAIKVET